MKHSGHVTSYMALLSLSQVIREVVRDVLHKAVGVFRIQVKHLIETPQINALQVTVRQCLHVGVCLYDAVID